MHKLVAIHQPNFFPWLGYFEKIARSDVFIFLDHVQLQKTGGTSCNRVKLLQGGEARWVTAPILRQFHGVLAIKEMEFQPANPWRDKLLKSLITNYRRAPFFVEVLELLEPLIRNPESKLARYNGAAVTAIAEYLGLATKKILWSSEIRVDGQSNDMLIALTRAVDGYAYLCGGGAAGYQNDAVFASSGVGLVYQNFQHPVYPQVGTKDHVLGLSVIDALMNIGVVAVRAALKSTEDRSRSL